MSTEMGQSMEFDYEWEYSPRVSVLFGGFTLVAVLGWFVTVALTAIHLFAIPAIPADTPVQGSIEVITSQWAYVFGIPLATLGGFYYLTTIGLALWWFDTRHPLLIKILTPITASGVAFSAYFVYLQLGVIGEICPFCMVSAAATVVLFALELVILRQSTTPSLSNMGSDLGRVLEQTNYASVLVPVLMGLVTIGGLFMVPVLPLPDVVPFV
ncbi:homolog to vitamin K epoxide reductase (plasmid) [Natrialba magadii ATCC 43099]|uniref:Homolog to vitamin K epoxide reductase n=2 Tax=Natrialba magadii (strain ATCC 43099 / DSM 3394 / CCM 3739 / CIP 104546 / IAM 13178 / JCM 8861 / NBRC 102185 / NCIMB 2190 / MS3) TaxID=547559 RepID=D3T0S8_NATMM|nr:vitamin K epoxide reductase family protein [Natrialba magadii]ADD07187.1 homolog to vitamin K epoxide reductase [Natrialba magadii ATCC 43099]